ncbi:MAG: hypothetical protein HZA54_11415 [Planctomycetes bacterium]|nr:hypothetical protein [Planctomycetota bacterium]
MRVLYCLVLMLIATAALAQDTPQPATEFEQAVWELCGRVFIDGGSAQERATQKAAWAGLEAQGDVALPMIRLLQFWKGHTRTEHIDSRIQNTMAFLGGRRDRRAIPVLASYLGPEESMWNLDWAVRALLETGDERVLGPIERAFRRALGDSRPEVASRYLSGLQSGCVPRDLANSLSGKVVPLLEEVTHSEQVHPAQRANAEYVICAIRKVTRQPMDAGSKNDERIEPSESAPDQPTSVGVDGHIAVLGDRRSESGSASRTEDSAADSRPTRGGNAQGHYAIWGVVALIAVLAMLAGAYGILRIRGRRS